MNSPDLHSTFEKTGLVVHPQKHPLHLRFFAEVAALMLVVVTLLITLVRLANDDPVKMARRVAEMSRSETLAELAHSFQLQD